MKPPAFAGVRGLGCVTYLKEGTEIVLYEVAQIKQRWSDRTPLMIVHIAWDHEYKCRRYVLQDLRGTRREVTDWDLATPAEEEDEE